jgi:hypothetical protein
MPLRHPSWLLLGASPCLLFSTAVPAQPPCALAYGEGTALAGVDGDVYWAKPWDPDGPGPLPPLLVLAGSFRTAGNQAARNIAAYEPLTGSWFALGNGLPGAIAALATSATGRLVVAADSAVHEWIAGTWVQLGSSLGTGFTLGVSAVAVLANGDVLAGGPFQGIGSAAIHGLARWNGSNWQAFGAPTAPWTLGTGEHILQLPNGDIYVAGLFNQIGGVACERIARFDGSQWHAVGQAPQFAGALVADRLGNLVAAGSFVTPTGTATLARWNGSNWVKLDQGLPLAPTLVAPLPNGALLANSNGGLWTNASGSWAPFAPWLQSTATSAGIYTIHAFATNDVLVAGRFQPTPLVPGRNVARWNGSSWSSPNPGSNGPVTAVAALPDGSLLAGGSFTQIDGVACNRFALRQGNTWTAVASTATAAPRRMLARPDGSAVVLGDFPNPTTSGIDFVMQWNGSQLQPIGTGLWGTRLMQDLGLAANGDALVSYWELFPTRGGFARWDGSSLVFTAFAGAFPRAITGLPNGDVLLGGTFQLGGNNVELARWNGSLLQAFATPLNGFVRALAVLPNGDVVAGGDFPQPQHIARWNGTAWQPLGAGLPYDVASLSVLPNGDLIAATIRQPTNVVESTVHRWNGSSWTLLADTYGRAEVVRSPNGTVVLHGEFVQAGGAVQAYLARLQPTCPASVLDRGGGCAGSAGPLTLRAGEPAWLGVPLATEASPLPAMALAMVVYGFAPWSLPLSLLHPAGLPGCTSLATPDLLQLLPSNGGLVRPRLLIPNTAALVGASFEHQVLGIELDAVANVTAITGSNALRFTIGGL